jgi:hypothetical protein
MNSIKTKKQVLSDNSDYKTLINAVIRELGGLHYVEDINRHGIEGGFPGFTYYSDTHTFAMRYRKLIVKLLEEQAEQLGEEVVQMVSGFGFFRRNQMDNEDRKELYKYLGGGRCEQSTITNLMAWFAAEEVCRMFEN